MSTLVSIRNLHKTYQRGPEKVDVLNGLDIDIAEGDFVALMGPSGSGKTTLLNLIGGLDSPTSGEIAVGGTRIDSLGSGQLSQWRSNNVGFVFQFYNLMPTLTAQKNVELPLLLTKLSGAQRKRNAEIALQLVGLADRGKHRPNELSGGQQQRVAIARAIVSDPTLLICDEPTGDLDRASAEEILGLLQTLNREHGKTIVMVTHDPKAAEYATHTLHLDKGSLVEQHEHAADPSPSSGASRHLLLREEAGGSMKYLHLIWAALFRSKTRTSLTLLSVIAAFLLFGMLDSVRVAFNSGGEVAGANRLITSSRLSITQMLPYSLAEQVRATPGVKQATYAAWFGGIYQDPKNFFANFSVSPDYLDLYPEFRLPAAQKKAWLGRPHRRDCR